MADWLHPDTFDVAVTGGNLRVARWGDSGPVVLALHGITASHLEWPYVARELQDAVRFVAPDLRGRGGSRDLPGPYGMKTHAADCVAILDHLEAETAVVVGHSMGAFVGSVMAMHHPERVARLVMIDGGVPIMVPPPDADVEQILHALIGPSIERCKMTFESVDACLEFMKQHPSVQDEGAWNEVVEAFVAYDLVGEPPELRSKVNLDAVIGDGRDSLMDPDVAIAVEKVAVPMLLLRAERGLLNQPAPLYPDELAEELEDRVATLSQELIEDINHYSIVLSQRGAKTVAERIRALIQPTVAPS